MDVESSKQQDKGIVPTTDQQPHEHRGRRIICMVVIPLILALVLLFTILALTVFKAKQPLTNVNSIALGNLDFSVDVARLKVYLNVTLHTIVTVKNPNKVGLKYSNSTVFLKYRSDVVGEAPIPAGKIGAGDTQTMNITLTLMADRLLSSSNLYSDLVSGTLPLQTYMRISGTIHILFNIHVVTYTTCNLDIDLSNSDLVNQKCHYTAKL
ncbi:Late [Abeliophyllum distichum]|uniref:Late n=1 Tax=Abeliophyllum distichum TaxID=126358 RepID=A0ABD1P572_9LAMI